MAEPNASSMIVHAAIARALADQGVDTIFGLIGDANLFMVDSFVRNHGGRFIASANEAGATLMAIGYAAITGKVGVATVTLGPGLSNTLSSLVEGVKGAASVVLLCGDTPVAEKHEISRIDQREFIEVTGAGFEQLRSPHTVAEDVATVFRRAAVEQRPVALNMPKDFQWQETEYTPVKFRVPQNRAVVPSSDDLDDAIGIIATAKRPLIVAGRGAIHPTAKAALIKLAERIDAPLTTTLKGKGLFQGHPSDLGFFGTMSSPEAVEAIIASDCIIAFGAGLNPYTTAKGSFLKGKRVVQVNLDRTEIGRFAAADAGVVGDSGLVADIILHWLDEAEIPASGFRRELLDLADRKATPPARPRQLAESGFIDLEQALQVINATVPENRVLVTDAGRFLGAAWRLIQTPDPQSFLFGLNYGSIGMGLSQAIGAATGSERTTLLISGDGGFMLGGLAEFNTAVRYGCDLIVVVCNDGSYGAEHIQFRNRGMDPALSLFDWPDFAPVAVALGGHGVTVRSSQDLGLASQAIRERSRPLLIDLKLDPDHVPQLPH